MLRICLNRKLTAKSAVFNMETASAGQAVLVGRKGNMHPEFVVTGLSAHAGADLTKGANAIVELAHKILRQSMDLTGSCQEV